MIEILAYSALTMYCIALLGILLYSLVQLHLLILYRKSRPLQTHISSQPMSEDVLPSVTVQLPVYNEPLVITRLIENIVRLDYPLQKLQIQVLDDSTDETKEIAAELIGRYQSEGINIEHLHRQTRQGFKAGALQDGLATATGEFIAIFDADFLPTSDFLRKSIPFFSSPDIGVVQGRWGHINEDYSLITRLQAFQLNTHFSIEQTGREIGHYFLQFNGTAGIWRKTTILDAGGWQDDTLTEDLDLSYRAQLKGWKIHYLQDLVVPAELPVEMAGLKSQQFRWMKGGAENAKRRLKDITASSLRADQKFHAIAHLLSSSIFLVVLFLAILSVPVYFLYPLAGIPLKVLFPFILSLVILGWVYYTGNKDTSWSGIHGLRRWLHFVILFPVFLSLTMGLSYHASKAILEGYRGKKSVFVRTPKLNIQQHQIQKHHPSVSHSGHYSIPWMEGLLSLYFFLPIIVAFVTGDTSFVAYHLLLCIGFGSIFILTIQHQHRR